MCVCVCWAMTGQRERVKTTERGRLVYSNTVSSSVNVWLRERERQTQHLTERRRERKRLWKWAHAAVSAGWSLCFGLIIICFFFLSLSLFRKLYLEKLVIVLHLMTAQQQMFLLNSSCAGCCDAVRACECRCCYRLRAGLSKSCSKLFHLRCVQKKKKKKSLKESNCPHRSNLLVSWDDKMKATCNLHTTDMNHYRLVLEAADDF